MEKRKKPTGKCKINAIAFIACSKSKAKNPKPAQFLYQGSLFRKSLVYTKSRFKKVYILSALYGVVDLNEIIIPYEKTLNNMPINERKKWAYKVHKQLKEKGINKEKMWFFTGKKYHEFFTGEKPLQGLSLGYQLQWFNKQM